MKFCKRCQAETAHNVSGHCKVCRKADHAAWRAANPNKIKAYGAAHYAANYEKIKAYHAARYAANPEKLKARNAAWRAANPEKDRATIAAWNAANPDKMKAASAAYYTANTEKAKACSAAYRAANPDKANAASAAWAKNNPEACRIIKQNRRARKRENGGVLSKGLSAKLFKLQKGLCPCCKQPLGDDFHLDHIVPLALGGPNTDGNIQLLRQRCNNQKSAAHPVDFMQSRGFLL